MTPIEESFLMRLIDFALGLAEPAILHGKIDEQAQIRAERDAADAAARAKFGVDP